MHNTTDNLQSSEAIKCLQINLQRSRSATAALNQFIIEKCYDIVFIQEPHVIESKVCGFPTNYKVLFNNKVLRPKTAIIIVNQRMQYLFIRTFSNTFATFVNLQLKTQLITIVSLYCSPLEDLSQELNYVTNTINTLKSKNIIIGMDSNSKNRIWFSDRNDSRGNIVIEFVSENNLFIINNNQELSTYHTIRGNSFIDLTVTNLTASNYVTDWQVLETDSVSDHRYIQFKINDEPPQIAYKNTIKYVTSDANWHLFRNKLLPKIEILKQEINSITTETQMNAFVEEFMGTLTKICDNSFRAKNYNKKFKKQTTGGHRNRHRNGFR